MQSIVWGLSASLIGLLIALVDSRPAWDDTGIIAGALLLVSAIFGTLRPRYAWAWALAVGAWVPLLGVVLRHNYGSILALAFAFGGAYCGVFMRTVLTRIGAAADS
jgi:nucleoside recognition membrane protein YjiH